MIMHCEIRIAGDEKSHDVKVLMWYSLDGLKKPHMSAM
jgi:hypothetical protein